MTDYVKKLWDDFVSMTGDELMDDIDFEHVAQVIIKDTQAICKYRAQEFARDIGLTPGQTRKIGLVMERAYPEVSKDD